MTTMTRIHALPVLFACVALACSSTGDGDGDGETAASDETTRGETSEDSADETAAALEPDGEPCLDASECVNTCHLGNSPGTCGECASDADCEGGCTPPLMAPPTCNAGALADACETSLACQDGLSCVSLLQFGATAFRGCSSCESDLDCGGEQQCGLVIDFQVFRGARECVDPASVSTGESCNPEPGGELACASGKCAEVTLFGSASVIGVCSECLEDADCDTGAGQICKEAFFSGGSLLLSPGTCVDP